MQDLPKLNTFPTPEEAMQYADEIIEKYGATSVLGVAACVLSNTAYAVLRA